MLGISDNSPLYCKRYSEIGETIKESIKKYKNDVLTTNLKLSPYKISDEELNKLNEQTKN